MSETFGNVFPIRRERTWRHNGRLIVLDNSLGQLKDSNSNTWNNAFSIDFPAMPEQIELTRRTTYRVSANMVLPDGIHQYMNTEPLEIPFSFKIHYGDTDYCAEGPLTLLKLAARLHSLATPLGSSDISVQVTNDGSLDESGNSKPGQAPSKQDATVNQKSGQPATTQGPNTSATYLQDSSQKTDPPVAVRLELIQSGLGSPGIVCTGYVKDVRAVLFGPWLRGPDIAYNLPSAGEYSFTFVHRPGHGNYFSNKAGAAAVTFQAQAYAQFIRERLYNTRDLTASNSQFRGWTVPIKSQ